MKYVLLILLLLTIGLSFVIAFLSSRTYVRKAKTTIIIPTIIPTQAPKQTKKTIQTDTNLSAYALIGPVKPNTVSLLSNLPQKQSSMQILQDNTCTQLTSGGFYTKEDTHIGLFLINDVVIQEQKNNSLFNSYIWNTEAGTAGIGQILPETQLSFALQTGPLLIQNSQPVTLRLRTDEFARRIAVGITTDGNLLFYLVTHPEQSYSGPMLEQLPEIISSINSQENISVSSVVNLDGGNHSAFLSKNISVQELSPVGSAFCIKGA